MPAAICVPPASTWIVRLSTFRSTVAFVIRTSAPAPRFGLNIHWKSTPALNPVAVPVPRFESTPVNVAVS